MLVSIIMPAYNAATFIEETLDSVLAQSYSNWELLIADDCSSDNTREIIEHYMQKDARMKLIPLEENHGPGLARDKAIEMAQGKYIAFLDSDDLWTSDKLEKQIAFMQKEDLAFSYASYYIINEASEQTGVFKTRETISYDSILKTCSIGCLTAVYDSEKLGKMYMPKLDKGEDYALWLSIMKKISQTKGILEPLGYYRIRTSSASSDKLNAAKKQWYVYREIEKLTLFKSIYYMVHYAYYGFKKYR